MNIVTWVWNPALGWILGIRGSSIQMVLAVMGGEDVSKQRQGLWGHCEGFQHVRAGEKSGKGHGEGAAKNGLEVPGGVDLACRVGSKREICHDVERGRSWRGMGSGEHGLKQVWVGLGSFTKDVRAWRSRREG